MVVRVRLLDQHGADDEDLGSDGHQGRDCHFHDAHFLLLRMGEHSPGGNVGTWRAFSTAKIDNAGAKTALGDDVTLRLTARSRTTATGYIGGALL